MEGDHCSENSPQCQQVVPLINEYDKKLKQQSMSNTELVLVL